MKVKDTVTTPHGEGKIVAIQSAGARAVATVEIDLGDGVIATVYVAVKLEVEE